RLRGRLAADLVRTGGRGRCGGTFGLWRGIRRRARAPVPATPGPGVAARRPRLWVARLSDEPTERATLRRRRLLTFDARPQHVRIVGGKSGASFVQEPQQERLLGAGRGALEQIERLFVQDRLRADRVRA